MHITVAICTWNRAKLLDQTLQQMRALVIPEGVQWELLVVNNNCTDETDEVIARHSPDLPLRRLFEPKQGHSHARNCAANAAQGELLIWTDDDVLVDPNWLAEYANAADRWPTAEYFGGFIEPWFEQPPPAWVSKNLARLQGMFVLRDLGSRERPFKPGEHPFGASMAFRRSAYSRLRFDPELGRVANGTVGHDDTQYCEQLQRSGADGIWVPAAKLRHFVVSDRMRKEFVWRYFTGYGQTLVRINRDFTGCQLFGAPRWLFRRFCESYFRYFIGRLITGKDWLHDYIEAAEAWGQIVEHRARRGSHRTIPNELVSVQNQKVA